MPTAIIEYYPIGAQNPTISQTVTLKAGEPNFVNQVGIFIQQNKLSPNHLIEKWYPSTRTIQLFETNDPPYTVGQCF